MDEFKFEGIWVVVVIDGTRGYIGKASIWGNMQDIQPEDKAEVVQRAVLKLFPAVDYFTPPMPMRDPKTGQPMVAREPIVMPLDFTCHETPIYVRWSSLMFFDDMHEDDRKTYEGYVLSALKRLQGLRAQKLGLEISPQLQT